MKTGYPALLESIGAIQLPNSPDYHLKTGATHIILRTNCDRLYCQVGDIYVGEITTERLMAIYFGLTGSILKLI